MVGFIDWHSHVLPGIDDGAQHRADSISALQKASCCGISRVIATPHFYPHKSSVDAFIERRSRSYVHLMKQAASISNLPEIIKGAEVLLLPGIDGMDGFEKLCIEGTRIMMLELPFLESEHTDEMYETVERIVSERGISVIMAHPHRYSDETISRMIEIGAMLQLNADDLSTFSGKKRAKKYFEMEKVLGLGTDFHRDLKSYERFEKLMRTYGKMFKSSPAFSLTPVSEQPKLNV